MSQARAYRVGVFDTSTWNATGATVTTTSTTAPTPILTAATPATGTADISRIGISCLGASSFPSNASFTAILAIFTGTVSGGNAATPEPTGAVTLAANTTFLTAGGASAAAISVASLALTQVLWTQSFPFTAGANWAEWVTPGLELHVPISAKFGLFLTESSAGSGTTFGGELNFTE